MKHIKSVFSNCRGEGHLDTGIKILIAVVIGALILGGLYMLFAGDRGIMAQLDGEVGGMINFGGDTVSVKSAQDASGAAVLQYSYDGKRWLNATMPDYGETSVVYNMIAGGEGENASHAALIQDGNTYYMLASADGITWTERFTFRAQSITHFYYGTDDALPSASGSFAGERFVLRYHAGGSTYFSPTAANATAWTNSTWSDLIPVS